MSKIRMAAVAAVMVCGLFAFSDVAHAQTTPMTKKVAITGTKGFKGTYTIQRFTTSAGKTYAVGTLKGTLKSQRVSKKNVRIPVALGPGTAAGASQLPPIPNACTILNLTLEPINLNLLGLSVRTSRIDLRIDAVPGAGNLLGNLLCGITNLLNPSALPTGSQLSQILNAILALL